MIVLLINVTAVLFMTGFIWTMQLFHYPLLDRVGAEVFSAYENDHNRLFFLVAGPGIILTFSSGVLLLFSRPPQVPLAAVVVGLLLFAVIVVSTILFQAPQHAILSRGFDRNTYDVPTSHQLDPYCRLDSLRSARSLDGLAEYLNRQLVS